MRQRMRIPTCRLTRMPDLSNGAISVNSPKANACQTPADAHQPRERAGETPVVGADFVLVFAGVLVWARVFGCVWARL